MLKILTDNNIDAILESDRTFLVLFQNSNSPNSDNLEAIFEEFAEKFQGKIDVYTCEYLENEKITTYFKTRVLPAITMLKRNKIYANIAGPVSATQYSNAISDGIRRIMEEDEEYKTLPDNEYTL